MSREARGFRRRGAFPVVSAALLLTGCARLGLQRVVESPPDESPPDTRLARAAELMSVGQFIEAEVALRRLAARCENREEGLRALLLLSALRLDPRNPEASPDSAALFAARFLGLPDAPIAERPLAESLYALALDLGADPGLRPSRRGGADAPAPRFSDCERAPADDPAPLWLPVLEREARASGARRLERARDSVANRAAEIQASNRALEARVAELAAELERIRRLLGADPDTTATASPSPR